MKAGRCTHIEPEGLGDEEKEEYMGKLADEDKTEERFKAINENTKVEKLEAWTSKVCGDIQAYNKVGGEGTTTYAVNVIRSNRWPGALTVSKGGKFCNLYVGDGIKRGQSFFNPTEPPMVESDPREAVEEPEPNGKDPVAVVEKADGEEDD